MKETYANCSISLKKPFAVPASTDSVNSALPACHQVQNEGFPSRVQGVSIYASQHVMVIKIDCSSVKEG